jgi:hypothetical protein
MPALEATNPLGFLAALGALDVLERAGRAPSLAWTDDVVPTAVVTGVATIDELVHLVDADRRTWAASSPLLSWPGSQPLPDIKPDPAELSAWARHVLDSGDRAAQSLFCALAAEGALDRSGKTKPTHLHFTAGQQKFLVMVRELAESVTPEQLRLALAGPWRYESTLPSLSWDARGERVYALRATDPSKGPKREGVPGADWLAFLGLGFYPVANRNGTLVTTACDRSWKQSALRWPVWLPPLSADTIRSLLADPELVAPRAGGRLDATALRARGLACVLEAPIRRSDQGGYGSFGAPDAQADVRSMPAAAPA